MTGDAPRLSRLAGKVALVTGAASGIGLAIAESFLDAGAVVVVVDVDEIALNRACEQWKKRGLAVTSSRTDVSDAEEVRRLFEGHESNLGHLDILVNCAGIGRRGSIEEMTENDWQLVLSVNLTSVFLCCKYAIPLLKRQRNARIINIASAAGIIGVPRNPAYCASKAGVILLTKQIACDYAHLGIRAHSICPTAVDTPLIQRRLALEPDPSRARAELEMEQGRLLTPEEVAAVALFLAADGLPNGPVAYIQ